MMKLRDRNARFNIDEHKERIKALKRKLLNKDIDEDEKAFLYMRLGFEYVDVNRKTKAKHIFNKALKIVSNKNIQIRSSILYELSLLEKKNKAYKYAIEAIKVKLKNNIEPIIILKALCVYYQNSSNYEMSKEVVDKMINSDLTRNDTYGLYSNLLEKANNLMMNNEISKCVELHIDIIIRKYVIGAKDRVSLNFKILRNIYIKNPEIFDDPNIKQKINCINSLQNGANK